MARDRTGYARKHARVLVAVFGAFLVLGLMRDNAFALVGGAAGLVWLAWAHRG